MRRGAPFLLQRFVLGEIALNLVISLLVITAVFFVGMVIQSLFRYRLLPVTTIFTLIPYFLPAAITLTIPLTVLIASVQTYGRMAADNEILAIRTSGMHLYPIVLPALMVGMLMSCISLYLNASVVPYCARQKKHITRSALDQVVIHLKTGRHTIPIRKRRLSFTRTEDGGYTNILISIPGKKQAGNRRIYAESAEISIDHEREKLVFHLRNGYIESEGAVKPVEGDQGDDTGRTLIQARFESMPMEIDLSDRQKTARPPLKECSLDDLFYRMKRVDLEEERTTNRTEIHKRISLSLASFVFALIGAPLGILFKRGGRMAAFLASFILAIAVYYPLLLFGEAVSIEGAVSPALGLWWANFLVGGIGVFLLARVFRQ